VAAERGMRFDQGCVRASRRAARREARGRHLRVCLRADARARALTGDAWTPNHIRHRR
jgi:hypothetical protein